MKRNLFLLGLAVAAMTSCTNDEVLEQAQPTQKAIGFESFVNKETRAVTETDNDITKFYAYGYYNQGTNSGETVFTGTEVSRTSTSSTEWTYDLNAETDGNQVAYWTKNIYQFAGYANGNSASELTGVSFSNVSTTDNGSTTNTPTLKIQDYTVSDDNDLVAGLTSVDNRNAIKSSEPVSFTFQHLLSKVKFTVINNDDKYKMRITSPLTISGVKTIGTCTVTSAGANWTSEEDAETNDNFVPVAATAAGTYIPINTGNEIPSDEYFVLPHQTLSDVVTFAITAEFYDDNNQVVATKTFSGKTIVNNTVPPANSNESPVSVAQWQPGYVYNYIISLPTAAKPIVFGDISVVEDWTSGGTIELNPNDDGTGGTSN